MNKLHNVTRNLNDKMLEDLVKLGEITNDYGPQTSQEAIEATQAALKDILFGISRNTSEEAELGKFSLASLIEEPANFFGSGKYSEELIDFQSLKPETITFMMKAVFMQLNASDNLK